MCGLFCCVNAHEELRDKSVVLLYPQLNVIMRTPSIFFLKEIKLYRTVELSHLDLNSENYFMTIHKLFSNKHSFKFISRSWIHLITSGSTKIFLFI